MKKTFLLAIFLLVTISFSYGQTWDFEENLTDWQIALDNAQIELTSEIAFEGSKSVQLITSDEDSEVEFFTDSYSELENGNILSLRLWIDSSNVAFVSELVFFLDKADDTNQTKSYSADSLIKNEWNHLWIQVEEDVSVIEFGIQIREKNPETATKLFIDLIEVQKPASLIQIPSLLKTDSVGTRFIAFSWNGDLNTSYYNIWRNSDEFEPFLVDSTTRTNYLDTSLKDDTEYTYWVSGYDSLGKETELSNPILIKTSAFFQDFTFDFESGSQGWSQGLELDSLIIVDSISYSGFHSVELKARDDEQFGVLGISSIIPESGQVFKFHFYIPSNTENIAGFSIVSDSANEKSTSIYNPIENFELGEWNKFSFEIPEFDTDDGFYLTFNVVSKTTGTSPIYIDLVTSDPIESGIPTVRIPSNFTSSILDDNNALLKWEESSGNGSVSYNVYKTTDVDHNEVGDVEFLASTSDTSFIDDSFTKGDRYYYFARAEDFLGRETLNSDVRQPNTNEFNSITRYDFETGSEGWYDFLADSPAKTVSSFSYSGVYSVELITPDTDQFSYIGFNGANSIQFQPYQIIYFQFFLPADTSNIRSISIASIFGEKVFFEETLVKNFEPEKWNRISYRIPEEGNLTSLAFNYFSKTTGTPPIYIDLITTEPQPFLHPHLSVPKNLQATTIGTLVNLTWSPSSGNDPLDEYTVYVRNTDTEGEFELIHRTRNTYYSGNFNFSGNYEFAVSAITSDGGLETDKAIVSITNLGVSNEDEPGIPHKFSIHQNYPNPFNPSTQIRYDIPETSNVVIKVYDITGRLVQTLVNELKTPGRYSTTFRADNLASGVYLYRIEAGSYTKVQRMLLIK